MIIHSLYGNVHFPFGDRYDSIPWLNEWYAFLRIAEKERKLGWTKKGDVNHLLAWFVKNVLQSFDKQSLPTLYVRLRIAVCMVNKISSSKLSPEMKYWLMQCFWDSFKKVERLWIRWNAKCEGLPF